MHSIQFHDVAVYADLLLSIAVCAVFSRPSLRNQYPWMFRYLCVRAVTAVAMGLILEAPMVASPLAYTKAHFVVYWTSTVILAVLLFLSCLDVYRQAMAPLPGLARMGTTVFTWAAIASVLVTATTISSISGGPGGYFQIALQLLRCAGATELCLLALLLLSMKSVGLSARSRPLGFALTLGLMASIDCAVSIVTIMKVAPTPGVLAAFEIASFLTLSLWIAYSAMPEPVRKAVPVPTTSAIYKWDQIASALGKNTQVVMQPSQSFFLVDVEKVVERAFVRTLKGKESES
jgi:hypothetical protein